MRRLKLDVIQHVALEWRNMEIRQDDPTAHYVADLLAYHRQELQSAMAEHAFALDAAGLSALGR